MTDHAKVTLGRNDLVRIAVQQLQQELADKATTATTEAEQAQLRFRAAVEEWALKQHAQQISELLRACGGNQQQVQAEAHLDLTDDMLDSPPTSCTVTIRDGAAWTCTFSFKVNVTWIGECELARTLDAWVRAERERRVAVDADTRVKAVDGAARAAVAERALETSTEGQEILERLRKMVKRVLVPNIGSQLCSETTKPESST